MVGGYNNWGNGATAVLNHENLPPHAFLRIQFKAYKVDSWDNERFQVLLDDIEVFGRVFQYTEGDDICGVRNSWHDKFFEVDVIVPHTSDHAAV
jgi:hypothetical protein